MLSSHTRITIGEFITEAYLKPLNMSEKDIADKMGLDASYVAEIISDKEPLNDVTAKLMSKALGISVASLLDIDKKGCYANMNIYKSGE